MQILIESIEALSIEEQALLFEQLYKRRIEKQLQENTKDNKASENPLLMIPATLKNNPLFDEVLGHMEAYRHEVDNDTEAYYHEMDTEAQAK